MAGNKVFKGKDVLQLLLKDKKVRQKDGAPGTYIQLVNGAIVDQAGAPATITSAEYVQHFASQPLKIKKDVFISILSSGQLEVFETEEAAKTQAGPDAVALAIPVKINVDIDEETRLPK